MNYGKTAYLKVVELEKKYQTTNTETGDKNGYLEFDKLGINQTIGTNYFEFDFPEINLLQNKDICFQIKITFASQLDDNMDFSLLLDQLEIHHENPSISRNQTDYMLIKTFSPIQSQTSKVSLKIKSNSPDNNFTISDIRLIIMGLSSVSQNSSLEFKALSFADNVLVSYIDSNRLNYQICKLNQQTLNTKDFIFYDSAISHCFMKSESDQETKDNLYLLVVDKNKNLYLKQPFNDNSSKLIDTNVSFVTGSYIESPQDQNLIIYIKNGEIFYLTIINGNILKSRKLPVPKGEYKEVCIACHSDSEYVYVIATTSTNSSYILRSVIETETGKFVETIKANYYVKISKYIDMQICDKLAVETLKADVKFLTNPYVIYNNFINKHAVSSLHCSISNTASNYNLANKIVYGVKLDKKNPIGFTWATYTDDAVGLEGAYMDFDNDIFVDNGWESRWPFSEIKPCLFDVKESKVLGYLDKNDYTKFLDGTNADIATKTSPLVAIEFPRIYYKISADEDYNYIQISNRKLSGFSSNAFDYARQRNNFAYVSAYPGPGPDYNSRDEILQFYSGMKIRYYTGFVSTISEPLRKYGKNITSITYQFNTLIGCLFAIMFKSTDIRQSLGVGFRYKKNYYYTGELNQKGMYYGSSYNGHTKLFGMEDYCGLGVTTSAGLIYSNTEGCFKQYNPMSTNICYIEEALNFNKYEVDFGPVVTKTVATDLLGENVIGFGAPTNETLTDSTKKYGFCDYCNIANGLTYGNYFGNESGGGGLYTISLMPITGYRNLLIRPFYCNNT